MALIDVASGLAHWRLTVTLSILRLNRKGLRSKIVARDRRAEIDTDVEGQIQGGQHRAADGGDRHCDRRREIDAPPELP